MSTGIISGAGAFRDAFFGERDLRDFVVLTRFSSAYRFRARVSD
jgi:hypothetical protein